MGLAGYNQVPDKCMNDGRKCVGRFSGLVYVKDKCTQLLALEHTERGCEPVSRTFGRSAKDSASGTRQDDRDIDRAVSEGMVGRSVCLIHLCWMAKWWAKNGIETILKWIEWKWSKLCRKWLCNPCGICEN